MGKLIDYFNNFVTGTLGINDISKAVLIFGGAVALLFLCIAGLMGNKINIHIQKEMLERRRNAGGSTTDATQSKAKSQTMDQLSKMITNLLEVDESDVSNKARNEITGASPGIAYKIKKFLHDMMVNPYNSVSIPKMVITCGILAFLGFSAGTMLRGIVFMVSLALVGLAAPVIYVSVSSIRNQLNILQNNMGLMASHLGIYKEANNFTDSLRSLLNVLTPDTREFKAIYSAHGALVEANMDLFAVIDKLKKDLLADVNVCQYFDLCYIADTKSTEYKDALDYLPKRLEPIVMKNILYVSIIKMAFTAYCLSAGIIIVTLFYYSFSEPDTFAFLTSTLNGQILSGFLMGLFVACGFFLSRAANLITVLGRGNA